MAAVPLLPIPTPMADIANQVSTLLLHSRQPLAIDWVGTSIKCDLLPDRSTLSLLKIHNAGLLVEAFERTLMSPTGPRETF